MRFHRGRLSAGATLIVVLVAGCRSGAGGASSDSTKQAAPPASPAAPSAGALTRADSIVLRTDKAQYRPGEAMTLTFENRSGSPYTFNPCTRTIEREAGGTWTALPDEGRMCTMQAFILAPHGTQTGTTELPSPLAPGRYRVAVRMTLDQPGREGMAPVYAVSDPIRVS